MFILDDPKRGKFERPGRSTATEPQKQAAWEHVLIGKARDQMMGRYVPSAAVLARAASLNAAAAQLKKMVKK